MDEFSRLHPISFLLYFFTIIFLSMFLVHPILIIVSFIASCIYFAKIKGLGELLKHFKYMIPFFIITSLFNCLFNQQGSTVLITLLNFSVTFEAAFYGCLSALNLVVIITWFSCFSYCFDSGKIMFLFSKISPSIALLFTSSVKTVGSLKQKYIEISKSKALLYGESFNKDVKSRLNEFYENILILINWAFESSIFTAVSMKARGAELLGRTNYSSYSFRAKDIIILIINICLIINTLFFIVNGNLECQFFPKILISNTDNKNYIFYIVYLLFCLSPTLMDAYEVFRCLKCSKLQN